MKQTLKVLRPADDIDGLIDEALADPSRADELKRLLRSRLHAVESAARDTSEEPDLWENVPV